MHPVHPPRTGRRASGPAAGFTLVELLLMAAVLAGLVGGGVAALLRHQRASSMAQLSDSAELRHARQLLQQEIAQAERFSTSAAQRPPACAGLENPLVLIGPGDGWRIVYGLERQGPPDGWRGPAQLQRCGPAYGETGLAAGAAEPPLRSVVLDRLAAASGFRTIPADGGVTISLQPHSNTGALPASTLHARLAVAEGATGSRARRFAGCTGLCEESDTTNHWRPGGGDIAGDAGKSDLIHFPFEKASYTFSEPCDRKLCTVSGIPSAVIYNGDRLMFSDQEVVLR